MAAATLPAGAEPPSAATAPGPLTGVGHHIATDLKAEITRIQPVLDRHGYRAVGVAVGVEGAGIPAPGQTILVAAALEAAARPRLLIGWVIAAAFAAAVLGNSLGYLIGRRGGRPMLRRLRMNEDRLRRVEDTFERWGGWLIVGARFFDGLRQLNGIAAGVLQMPWWRFTFFNLLGAALWVAAWGLGAYYLDEHMAAILTVIRGLNPWVATATLIGLVVLAAALWVGARRAGRAPAPPET